MFFGLSKILWGVAAPANLLFIAAAAGTVLLWTRWWRFGRRLVALVTLLILAIATLPIGSWILRPLEDRFPMVSALPAHIDGIVVLGGVVSPVLTEERGTLAVGDAVERLTEFAALARHYPQARLVFTGGTGSLTRQDLKEADVIGPFWRQVGLEDRRIVYENQSRNTYENAVLSRPLAGPDETWILVTSAFHMPRAVGCFRKAGWTVLPYPVDYKTGAFTVFDAFKVAGHLSSLDAAVREWLGLAFYRLTGRTDSLFPGPGDS